MISRASAPNLLKLLAALRPSTARGDKLRKPPQPASKATRLASLESLESRDLLSADVASSAVLVSETVEIAPASVVADQVAVVTQALAISAIDLSINGKVTTVGRTDLVQLQVGDVLNVVGIHYESKSSDALEGVIAFEGYLHKLGVKSVDGFDYGDGRFGNPSGEKTTAAGLHDHPGLKGEWKVDTGVDRLSVTMVRYFGDSFQVEDHFCVAVLVGSADLSLDAVGIEQALGKQKLTVGKVAEIDGVWHNLGKSTVESYAEVDVYLSSDLSHPVWSGALAGVAGPGGAVSGEYVNSSAATSRNGFSERWTPAKAGTYVFKFYVDPENTVAEWDELNNESVLKVSVGQRVPS